MKIKIKHLFIFILFAFFSFTSCQDEISEIENPNEQEIIIPDSSLANLMSRTSANYGAADDILDGASCFSIELPVTIELNDITIIIETEAGLEQLEDLLNTMSDEESEIDFIFPITIIFSDYSEIVIENEDQLETFIDQCIENENDVIECADFVYPISFSAFNAGFNLIDTVVIENDEALYVFLNELEDEENALIVSLNFPVTIAYANGETIDVNTNEELATAIEVAEQFCEDDCDEESIELALKECLWEIDVYSSFPEFQGFFLEFNTDYTFNIIMADNQVISEGNTWSVVSNTTGSYLVLTTDFEDFDGDWLITECNDDNFVLSKGNQNMVINQECEDDSDCSAIAINSSVTECAWSLETNLITDYPVDVYIHFGSEGAVMIEGADNLESQIGTWEITAIASDVFFEFTLQSPFDVLNGQWQVSECLDGYLYLQNGNNNIELDEACEINNQALLDCYSIYVLSQECDNDNDGIATFVIETSGAQSAECIALYPIAGTMHPTYQDAVNTTNILNINITDPTELESQSIFYRVFNQDTHEYAVQELELIVETCNDEVFNCFDDFEIVECEQPNNIPVYNLSANTIGLVDCTGVYYPSFHETLMDAQNDTNAIANTEAYETLVGEVYLRIEAESGNFQIFNVYLNTVECNYFECFESFDAVIETCYSDAAVLYEFNLEIAFANCTPSADNVSYFETQSDAETGVNPIATPWEYTTAELNSTIYVQVIINDIYEIFLIQLNVINCNAGSCTEGDIDGILTNCQWNITSYNGSDNLSSYNFNFEENSGIVVIYNDTITIDASWSTSQPNDGVIIEFSNVAGPNIQAINGSWLVVECTAEQLVLHNVNDSNNEIVLDRTCE